jgi:hypothetical protein
VSENCILENLRVKYFFSLLMSLMSWSKINQFPTNKNGKKQSNKKVENEKCLGPQI